MKLNSTHLRLPRSPLWPALRAKWIRDHPTCAACGCTDHLEVHHIIPVHVSRALELDADNLITLCEDATTDTPTHPADHRCHLKTGHLGNWFSYNKNVRQQAHQLLLKTYPTIANVAAAEAAHWQRPSDALRAKANAVIDTAAAPVPTNAETSPLNRSLPRPRRH